TVGIIVEAVKGITTRWGSARILKQFDGKSPGFMRSILQELKSRATENKESPQGMIRWLFRDMTAEDSRDLRQLLIKNRVLEDLGPILIEELVDELKSWTDSSQEIMTILTQFGGEDLDNILRQLQ